MCTIKAKPEVVSIKWYFLPLSSQKQHSRFFNDVTSGYDDDMFGNRQYIEDEDEPNKNNGKYRKNNKNNKPENKNNKSKARLVRVTAGETLQNKVVSPIIFLTFYLFY